MLEYLEYLALPATFGYHLDAVRNNAPSADNQQETPNLSRGILRDYTSDIVPLSKDLTTLVAMLYTDGCLSPHGVRSWRLYFSNTSEVAINLFVNSLVEVFGLQRSRLRVKKRKDGVYAAILTSKEVGDFLTKSFGTFRTLRFRDGSFPKASLPVEALVKSVMSAHFLKVAFSMDGGVKFYPAFSAHGTKWLERNIFLSCTHPKLRRQYCFLLSTLGVCSTIVERDSMVKIMGRKNLEIFGEKIGFIEGMVVTKHSRFWCGTEKNVVMHHLTASYGNASQYLSLPNFSTVMT